MQNMKVSENEMLILYAQELMGRACDGIITPTECHDLFSSAISDGVPIHEQTEIHNYINSLALPDA
jgi:succinyl-CoA synthetase alpha subunit